MYRLGSRLPRTLPAFTRRWQSGKSSGNGVGSFFRDSISDNTETAGDHTPDNSGSGSTDTSDLSAYRQNKDLRNHPYIKAKLDPTGETAAQSLLSPLKRTLYAKVCEANGGVYKNKQLVEHEGVKYKLSLTRQEQIALEPTVYVQSYRIKSSWKKMYMFLRIFRRMGLTEAITQCHFSAKRRSQDVADMLERGRNDAIKLGLDPENLVVDQIWVGKDGDDLKRVHFRGRGRAGIIRHPYVHVKAVLKDRLVLQQREQWQKDRLDRKLWMQLRNWKIKEDFVQTANYKW